MLDKKLTAKQAFSLRLEAERIRKGWSQSDLARAAAKFTHDKKFGRYLVSSYENGKMLPTVLNLEAMAKALGVDRHSLLPMALPDTDDGDQPLSIQDAGDGLLHLRVNQAVPKAVALEIIKLITGGSKK